MRRAFSWEMHNDDTIYPMPLGRFWSLTCLSKTDNGGISIDNTMFINAVFWILRTGAPWRDLPPEYGRWGTAHQQFIRWRDKLIWENLLEILIDEPDFEWLMIDAGHCKVHPHATGVRGGNQGIGRTKGGSTVKYTWPWMRMVCQSELLLQRAS